MYVCVTLAWRMPDAATKQASSRGQHDAQQIRFIRTHNLSIKPAFMMLHIMIRCCVPWHACAVTLRVRPSALHDVHTLCEGQRASQVVHACCIVFILTQTVSFPTSATWSRQSRTRACFLQADQALAQSVSPCIASRIRRRRLSFQRPRPRVGARARPGDRLRPLPRARSPSRAPGSRNTVSPQHKGSRDA
jgi:hypothetical protein